VRTASATGSGNVDVQCSAGEKATGGGGFVSSAARAVEISQPLKGASPAVAGDTPTGWRVHSNGLITDTTTAYVICAA
jgi:hypothetical protein